MKRPTEEQYIVCTDLAKVRALKAILRDICPGIGNGIRTQSYDRVAGTLRNWEDFLERKISPEDAKR